jgi:hypothetical protein
MQKQVQVVEILHLLLLVLHGVQPMYSPGGGIQGMLVGNCNRWRAVGNPAAEF